MNIFLPSGYLDMHSIKNSGYPFIFITGARGTGKTYGAVSEWMTTDEKAILMRRTQTELDLLKTKELNPYEKWCRNTGNEITTRSISKQVYRVDLNNEYKGLMFALSTIHNARGFSAPEVKTIYYDEFIPERHASVIKLEGEALLNAYETVNRNRELEGEDPVQLICLSNANTAGNPIYMELGLVKVMERMQLKEKMVYTDDNRGILMINLEDSPISHRKKKETALGKLTDGSAFAKMAFDNEFSHDDFSDIEPQKLTGFAPLVKVGEITIYKHKSKSLYYVSEHLSGSPEEFTNTEQNLLNFRNKYFSLWLHYVNGHFIFENFLTKTLFLKYTKG